jgi:hypothetical protein
MPLEQAGPLTRQAVRPRVGVVPPARRVERPAPYVEHYGAGAGFWNAMRIYPDSGLGLAVTANTTASYGVDSLFAALAGLRWY